MGPGLIVQMINNIQEMPVYLTLRYLYNAYIPHPLFYKIKLFAFNYLYGVFQPLIIFLKNASS